MHACVKEADSVGAYLLADMAHISGLVATGQARSPFDYMRRGNVYDS